VIHQHIDPAFMPTHALDFGCGVGRLVIPLAKICSSVTGIDISEAMLAEARNNCQEQKISNVNLVKGDDSLSGVPGTFDFIHSFIVFQHIPQQRGEAIFRRLVGMLQENGIGVVHFTYAQKSAWHSGALVWLYEHIPLLLGVRNLLKGRAFGEPMMQMNEYNLNRIFEFLQDAGCHHALIRFTDHGVRGIVVFFQQKRLGIL
jgi:ubiquinone/menaquinone biosynthesis C-methylase UbiE